MNQLNWSKMAAKMHPKWTMHAHGQSMVSFSFCLLQLKHCLQRSNYCFFSAVVGVCGLFSLSLICVDVGGHLTNWGSHSDSRPCDLLLFSNSSNILRTFKAVQINIFTNFFVTVLCSPLLGTFILPKDIPVIFF